MPNMQLRPQKLLHFIVMHALCSTAIKFFVKERGTIHTFLSCHVFAFTVVVFKSQVAHSLITFGTYAQQGVYQQDNVIKSFSSNTCLKLNTSKCEVVRISPPTQEQSVLQVGDSHISISEAAKCLGVWWNSSLSARHSVTESVGKLGQKSFLCSWQTRCLSG